LNQKVSLEEIKKFILPITHAWIRFGIFKTIRKIVLIYSYTDVIAMVKIFYKLRKEVKIEK
jgi:hypothetical protein